MFAAADVDRDLEAVNVFRQVLLELRTGPFDQGRHFRGLGHELDGELTALNRKTKLRAVQDVRTQLDAHLALSPQKPRSHEQRVRHGLGRLDQHFGGTDRSRGDLANDVNGGNSLDLRGRHHRLGRKRRDRRQNDLGRIDFFRLRHLLGALARQCGDFGHFGRGNHGLNLGPDHRRGNLRLGRRHDFRRGNHGRGNLRRGHRQNLGPSHGNFGRYNLRHGHRHGHRLDRRPNDGLDHRLGHGEFWSFGCCNEGLNRGLGNGRGNLRLGRRRDNLRRDYGRGHRLDCRPNDGLDHRLGHGNFWRFRRYNVRPNRRLGRGDLRSLRLYSDRLSCRRSNLRLNRRRDFGRDNLGHGHLLNDRPNDGLNDGLNLGLGHGDFGHFGRCYDGLVHGRGNLRIDHRRGYGRDNLGHGHRLDRRPNDGLGHWLGHGNFWRFRRCNNGLNHRRGNGNFRQLRRGNVWPNRGLGRGNRRSLRLYSDRLSCRRSNLRLNRRRDFGRDNLGHGHLLNDRPNDGLNLRLGHGDFRRFGRCNDGLGHGRSNLRLNRRRDFGRDNLGHGHRLDRRLGHGNFGRFGLYDHGRDNLRLDHRLGHNDFRHFRRYNDRPNRRLGHGDFRSLGHCDNGLGRRRDNLGRGNLRCDGRCDGGLCGLSDFGNDLFQRLLQHGVFRDGPRHRLLEGQDLCSRSLREDGLEGARRPARLCRQRRRRTCRNRHGKAEINRRYRHHRSSAFSR